MAEFVGLLGLVVSAAVLSGEVMARAGASDSDLAAVVVLLIALGAMVAAIILL
jgi:hypothetical protein